MSQKTDSRKIINMAETKSPGGLKRTLLIWFLTLSIIPLTLVSYLAYASARSSLHEAALQLLTSEAHLEVRFINNWFRYRLTDLALHSELSPTVKLLTDLTTSFEKSGENMSNFVKSREWAILTVDGGNSLRVLSEAYDYYDIYLIDLSGNVIFSVREEDDLGTNLLTGKYRDTKFARSCQAAFKSGSPVFSDLEYYPASGDLLAGFLTQLIVDDNGNGMGLMAIQLKIDRIVESMREMDGHKTVRQTYLIGEDLLMRTAPDTESEAAILNHNAKLTTDLATTWLTNRKSKDNGGPAHAQSNRSNTLTMRYTGRDGEPVLGSIHDVAIAGIPFAIVSEIVESAALAPAVRLRNLSLLILAATVALVIGFALMITGRIVRPIRKLSSWARKIAVGDLSFQEIDAPENEIGELNSCFREVVGSFRSITNLCRAVALGDLSKSVMVRSKNDVLTSAVNEMGDYLRSVVEQANTIAMGNYSAEVGSRGPGDQLGVALVDMTATLREVSLENERAKWVADGGAKLNELIRGDQTVAALGTTAIRFVSDYLGMQVGALYVSAGENRLELVGSYACSEPDQLAREFVPGEGIIGQAVADRKTIVLSAIPAGYMKIKSALGSTAPRRIIAVPLVYNECVSGVIELATTSDSADNDGVIDLLERISETIAIAIHSAQNRENTKILLDTISVKEAELAGQIEAINRANATVEYDMEGQILVANDTFLDLMGYTIDDIRGKHHSLFKVDWVGEADRDRGLWQSLKDGKYVRGEFQRLSRGGKTVWLYETYNLIFDTTGKPSKVLQIAVDITQQKEQEHALKTQHEELTQTNEELAMQSQSLQASEEELRVQQDELMHANQELEEKAQVLEEKNQEINEKNIELEGSQKEIAAKAEELALNNKYKSEFLANMSHELRTPLNSILLLSKLLSENRDGSLNSDQVEYAAVIHNSGASLLELINDVLDISKVEAGKLDMDIVDVHISEVTSSIESMFVPLMKDKKIRFEVSTATGTPEVMRTDRGRLEQILKNFLSNALKFSERGKVGLHIRPVDADEDELSKIGFKEGSYLSFAVSDTGIGIPHDKQKLVFEAFQQADGSTRRKYGGTGLGLSISNQLAAGMGGAIRLHSEPDKGSTFTLYLPVFGEAVIDDPAGSRVDIKEETSRSAAVKIDVVNEIPSEIPDDRHHISKGDKVILIIEDDTIFAGVLLEHIHERGFKGVVAVRGDTGLAFAGKYRPYGILLDVQLPVIDGWEVMDRLKKDSLTADIPVHMMSSGDVRNRTLKRGAVEFLQKPLLGDELTESLNVVLDKIRSIRTKTTRTILIIEDNEAHAKSLSAFLTTSCINCICTGTAAKGITVIENKDVDCVILDMGLPDVTGYEALEQIRTLPGCEALPIIVYTGRSLSIDEENRIKKYAETVIIKTVDSYQRLRDETSLFLNLLHKNENPKPIRKAAGLLVRESFEGLTALLADDDMRNVFAITKSLEDRKMTVVSAGNGKEALSLLNNNHKIDIVLMDIMMPELDGLATIRKIRKQKKFKKLPIIAVTAKTMVGDRAKCIKAGASDYISKPVDIDQLISLMRVWLY